MNRFYKTAVSALLLLSFIVPASAKDTAYAWYCVRNNEHKQPRPDANISFIEEYDGFYVDRKHDESCDEKVIYLTFDAGYENGNIEKILDVMKRQEVQGAFFILSHLIFDNPELVCRMANEGHTVGNHTSKHRDMSLCKNEEEFATELEKLEALYLQCTGKPMAKFFRPPEGRFSENTLRFAKDLGYKTIFWSFAYEDWDNAHQMSPEKAKKKILDNLHNGAILLLHPTSQTNAEILEDIIVTLKAGGYSFGNLEDLVSA